MSRVLPETWLVLDPSVEDAKGLALTRLDLLFDEDPFVAMLEVRLRSQVAQVLAEGGAVFHPAITRRILDQTPYAKLWSEQFIRHIRDLVVLAHGQEQG